MSLSPDDDPRNWMLPGASRPPFHARVLYYDLTRSERALVLAFDEVCSSQWKLWASMETYALHSGLSLRTVYDLIHGRNRKGRYKPGFIDRGILTEDHGPKPPRKGWRYTTPATYVFHEAAIPLHPKALARQDARRQRPTLPGIPRPVAPGEPFDTRHQVPRDPAPVADDTRHQVHRHPAPVAGDTRHQVHRHPAPVADDSKALDSKTLDTREGDSRARVVVAEENRPPFNGERFSITYSQTDVDELKQLNRFDDDGDPSKDLFAWLCRRTGATGRRPVLFEIQLSPADEQDLAKAERAVDEYWQRGPGSEHDAPEWEFLDPENPRCLPKWACDRIGITAERWQYLEFLQLQKLFSTFEFPLPDPVAPMERAANRRALLQEQAARIQAAGVNAEPAGPQREILQ